MTACFDGFVMSILDFSVMEYDTYLIKRKLWHLSKEHLPCLLTLLLW